MTKLICRSCGKVYPPDLPIWRCKCGGLLDLDIEYGFTLKNIQKRAPTMWRYREAIPIKYDRNIVSFDEGFTPLLRINLSGKEIYVKQDHLFQTCSFKDRGASVLISKVRELGIKEVLIDSSGNAGCAVAAYCARADVKCQVYVPGYTSPKKIEQIKSYGARLTLIKGTRDDTAHAALAAANRIYYASHYWNPFFVHGIKTFAFEICEQLGWKSPDTVILPAGNGTLLIGVYLGFVELNGQGIISRIPSIIGVQAANCAPLNYMLKYDLNEVPRGEPRGILAKANKMRKLRVKQTIAEGIAIAEPVRAEQIVQIIKKTKGSILMVAEKEITDALVELSGSGFYVEPTAAVGIAGTKKYLRQRYCRKETIVTVFTGHGLKAK